MTYQQVLENARTCIGPYCKACNDCNGKVCRNTMPGPGAKGEGRRNFELGMITDDEDVIDQVQALYEHIWRGAACRGCKLRDSGCEAPIDIVNRAASPG